MQILPEVVLKVFL